ncbi:MULTISPECIES: potassium-transporting ATPase subunit F [Calothrix]|uniref:Potassium-transporting ATPase subunit F n=2 Tax=Calothrix TaxID=1186 RepID=A0ABR8AFQ2_9CYAN|nr:MULTISPECIES: potassium-transporting ATPase subunit F [Calothrix]MBD2198875.1 potassium-transporting ATPase subunit F [Calothrix parietina FACHB-288]MBD2227550.1 potassium-transporting ATPase subunit F [Calothrix anomala FACHB-343]
MKNKIENLELLQLLSFLRSQSRKQKLPLAIFIVLCLNLAIAPVVYAAADGELERRSAWAIGILSFITIAIVIYLFVVIFQPERF